MALGAVVPVISSNLASVGYDDEWHILQIGFRSGGVYRYAGVPEDVYTSLLTASSKGRYFHRAIKRAYGWTRVR